MEQRPLIIGSIVIACGVLGAIGAGSVAARRGQSSALSRQYYLASLVNPPSALDNQRAYNQTLAESVDAEALAANLEVEGYTASSIRFDVLPDSFHLQATVSTDKTLTNEAAAQLGEELTTAMGQRSAELASRLMTGDPRPEPRVTLTRVLPAPTATTASPQKAALFGALSGALLGLFLGLSWPGSRR